MSLKQTYQKIYKKKILVHFDISLKTTFQYIYIYIFFILLYQPISFI